MALANIEQVTVRSENKFNMKPNVAVNFNPDVHMECKPIFDVDMTVQAPKVDVTVPVEATGTVEKGAVCINVSESLTILPVLLVIFVFLASVQHPVFMAMAIMLCHDHFRSDGQIRKITISFLKNLHGSITTFIRERNGTSLIPNTSTDVSVETIKLMETSVKRVRVLDPEEKVKLIIGCLNLDVASISPHGHILERGFIIMGNTGSGKSTFINYLHGCMMVKEKKYDMHLVGVSKESKVKVAADIGHTPTSATLLPATTLLKDPQNNSTSFAIVDTPGFKDNRSSEINIANAVNTLAVTNQMNRATFVLVMRYADVNILRYAGVFRDAVDTMKKFFGDTSNASDSILLAINRADTNATLEGARANIRQLDETDPFLSKLAGNTFFYDPLQDKSNGCFCGLNDSIQLMKSVNAIEDTSAFAPFLAEDDLACVRDIMHNLQEKIVKLCKENSTLSGDTAMAASSQLRLMSKLRSLKIADVNDIVDAAQNKIIDHYLKLTQNATEICAAPRETRNLKEAQGIIDDVQESLQNLTNGSDKNDADFEWLNGLHEKVSGGKAMVENKQNEETPPEGPSGLVAATITDISVNLSWNEPFSYTSIQTYQLSLDGILQDQEFGATTQHMLCGLSPGREYKVQVRAKNTAGYGDWSGDIAFKTTVTLPGVVREMYCGDIQDASIQVVWKAPEVKKNATEIVSYKIMVNGNEVFAGYICEGRGHNQIVQIDRLKPGAQYSVSVQARNLAGLCEEKQTLDGISTSNLTQKGLDEKVTTLATLEENPDEKEEVYSKHYYNRDSDVFSCAHISGEFKCDYKIATVVSPERCNSFSWNQLEKGGCGWKGNSQTNGKVDGQVKVYAKRSDKYQESIQVLKKEIAEEREGIARMHQRSRFG